LILDNSDEDRYVCPVSAGEALIGTGIQRCPRCRTKIIVPEPDGLVVKNAVLRVSAETGQATAKCPRCKTWVEVPLSYRA
jgi:phage FluMu protein Com